MSRRESERPAGTSSRLRRGRTRQSTLWTAPNGQTLRLPVVLDLVHVDPETHAEAWRIEATVDVV
ncbi:MAG: hypothetical protein ACKOYM_02170, partial [Actinomycetes bacterium]